MRVVAIVMKKDGRERADGTREGGGGVRMRKKQEGGGN
jgi:hypothetical protein